MNWRRCRFPAAGILLAALVGCGASDNAKAYSDGGAAERVSMTVGESLPDPDPELAGLRVTLPDAKRISSWSQAGGGARQAGSVHADAGTAFEIAWSVRLGRGSGRTPIAAPPVIAGGLIFVLDGKKTVHAVDTEGKRVWNRRLTGLYDDSSFGIGGALSVADGKVIVSPGYRYVAALDAQTGEELWLRQTDSPVTGSATIMGGRAHVTSGNNELYVINIDDGSVIWSDQGITETARVLAAPAPAISAELLVVPYSSGELVAYLPINGRRLWTDALTVSGRFSPVSALSDIAGRPVIVDDTVYAVSQSGILAAIDTRNGIRRWAQEVRSIGTPTIGGEFLFLVTLDARVICFQRSDGKVVWTRQLRQKRDKGTKRTRRKPIIWSGPIMAANRLVVVSSDGIALGLSPQTGATEVNIDLIRPVHVDPIASGEHLYFLAADGTLIAVR